MPCPRKYLAIVIAAVLMFIAIGCSSGPDQSAEVEQSQQQPTTTTEPFATPVTERAWVDLSDGQIQQRIDDGTLTQIIDLRETYYYTNKHIKGADSLPMRYLTDHLRELDKTKPILVYDDNDKVSRSAADMLAKNGFKQVFNFSGGMVTWTGPVEP